MTARHILIIDDNPDDIELCSRVLSKVKDSHYHVDPLMRPAEALTKVKQKPYDCIIIDFHFPSTSGLKLLEALRQEFAFIPVVILTGQSNEVHAANLIKAGAQDYINKASITSATLHRIISEAILRANAEQQQTGIDEGQCQLLIIDDNPDDIEFCTRSLSKKSQRYRFQSANTGEEGLQKLAQFVPDCILLDNSLPGRSGIDLLPQILAIYPHIPIIIMTGQGNEMIAVEAIKRGAENYLVKSSLNADILDQKIAAAVAKKQLEHELSKKEQLLREQQQELKSAYAFQDMMFESLPDFVFVKDNQFRLVKANQAFINLYPKDAKIIGYTTVEDYPEAEADAFLAKDKEAFSTGFSETMETITFPNGEIHTLYTQKKRFDDAKGETFILGVAKDVTERENMLKELRKSNADLEQFAYVASHDLKSPLNGIKKLVSWIEEDHGEQLPEEAQKHFGLIKSRAERMSQLLTDLLDYAKVNTRLSGSESLNFYDVCQEVYQLNEYSVSALKTGPSAIFLHIPRQ